MYVMLAAICLIGVYLGHWTALHANSIVSAPKHARHAAQEQPSAAYCAGLVPEWWTGNWVAFLSHVCTPWTAWLRMQGLADIAALSNAFARGSLMEGQASGQLPPAGGHSKRSSRDYSHHYDGLSSQASSQLQVGMCITWSLH